MGSSDCIVLCVHRCYFTVVSFPKLHRRIPNASLFCLCKESVLSSCACVIFVLVLIIQGGCRMCQVCVFSHQDSLEMSKLSQAVDVIFFVLFFSFNHRWIISYYLIISFLPSVLAYLSGLPIIFFNEFPGSVLQFLYYRSVFPLLCIFALDLAWPEFDLKGLFLQIS